MRWTPETAGNRLRRRGTPPGGAEARGTAPTWRARLTEMELTQEVVEVYAPSLGVSQSGRIRVIAADHLWLADPTGFDSHLPIEEIAVVIRPITTL